MVDTLTFKLLLGSFFLCVFPAFFFIVGNKTKITYFLPGMETDQISRGGGSLSRQPAGFEKAEYVTNSFVQRLSELTG